ncbi:MAG: DUF2905 domain-containing protein [Candidatus Dadabacteria bacterium]|nr:DUF2905 domain-containing protein [Candidatus Dadabacteria bacterium]NIS08041.1 DUF2905 domain-containing protein [Candidatus Dadabacteria bacterium]NIV40864.1 DUF2905 family protein [Candidatus Dadabacteria bacterium]NIY21619.1 DUF2905 family protein [Candidatus Dadabacteria bacterium]
MPENAGFYIIIAGVALIIIGAIVWTGALSWFGNLPGDIKIEREGAKIYIPITSMLVVSVVLSVLYQIIKRI